MREHKGWHNRGYLPHCDSPDLLQGITFRLHDAVPSEAIEQWKQQLKWIKSPSTPEEQILFEQQRQEIHHRIAKYEDRGAGECLLSDPSLAGIVEGALHHFDHERYLLKSWCIMPNHVHVLIRTLPGKPLGGVAQSWKRFSGKECNSLLGRNGTFWAPDYYDRFIRDEAHYHKSVDYIHQNPVKAGLCKTAEDWPWSSAKHH